MKNFLIISVFMVMVVGCGKKQTTPTQLEVSYSAITAGLSAKVPGGLIIYGRNEKGTSSFAQVLDSDSFKVVLDNGVWSFYSLAWDGTSPMKGNLYCAVSRVKLEGKPVTVPLESSIKACDSDHFADDEFRLQGTGLKPLKFKSCKLSFGNVPYLSLSNCYTNPRHQSYLVSLPSYFESEEYRNIAFDKSLKRCIGPTDPYSNYLPIGSEYLNLNLKVEAFLDQNCGLGIQSPAKNIFHFPTGLFEPDPNNPSEMYIDEDDSFTHITFEPTFDNLMPVFNSSNVKDLTLTSGQTAQTYLSIFNTNGLDLKGLTVTSCSLGSGTSLPGGLYLAMSTDNKNCVLYGTHNGFFPQTLINVNINTAGGSEVGQFKLKVVPPKPVISVINQISSTTQSPPYSFQLYVNGFFPSGSKLTVFEGYPCGYDTGRGEIYPSANSNSSPIQFTLSTMPTDTNKSKVHVKHEIFNSSGTSLHTDCSGATYFP